MTSRNWSNELNWTAKYSKALEHRPRRQSSVLFVCGNIERLSCPISVMCLVRVELPGEGVNQGTIRGSSAQGRPKLGWIDGMKLWPGSSFDQLLKETGNGSGWNKIVLGYRMTKPLVSLLVPPRSLRSSVWGLLVEPRFCAVMGSRAFMVLPLTMLIRCSNSFSSFKKCLRTYYLSLAFRSGYL